ncbi:MAG: conjugal transfer protein TraL [Methylobacter sp.]|nr:MAG: conjugal transfer protein TraL [Methylobacter sp.]
MAKIHLVLQGKGGVGKSLIAALIAQYKISKGHTPLCVDTDPVNATLNGYKKLNVTKLDILDGDEINSRHFDKLIEMIAGSESDIVIDNGASSFVPLSNYLTTNAIPQLLKDLGHTFVIHTVVTGGQALVDTVAGFGQLVQQYPEEAEFVVWLNPYWGPIEDNGKGFEQMKAYTANKARVAAIVKIPELKAETFGRDLSDMLQDKMTFEEAIAAETNSIMMRQRLKLIQRQLFEQMDTAAIL